LNRCFWSWSENQNPAEQVIGLRVGLAPRQAGAEMTRSPIDRCESTPASAASEAMERAGEVFTLRAHEFWPRAPRARPVSTPLKSLSELWSLWRCSFWRARLAT